MKYAYRIERHKGKYWGSVLDLQVCIGNGRTLKALEDDVRAAIEAWVESQAKHGYAIPPAHAATLPSKSPNARRNSSMPR